jgi:YVTN family beta-propeller protein
MRRGVVLLVSLTLLLAACGRHASGGQTAAPATLGLTLVADVPLPGDSSRLDYQSLDTAGHRLYIAHLSASQVIVVDTQNQTVALTIDHVDQVHGVLAVPALGRLYASATGANQVVALATDNGRVVGQTDGGDYPDGLAYDPDDGKLFVSDEQGGTDTVIDTQTNQRTGSIALGGDVGNTQYDPTTHRIYVAIGARNQLAVVDPSTDTVTARYDLPGCSHAHGLALDTSHQLAFVACDANATLILFDLTRTKITATYTVGDSPDVLALDTSLHRLYVAAESGVVAVFAEQGSGLTKLGQAKLAANAHTVAVDSETHRIYFPLENVGGHPVLRVVAPTSTETP